jgi:hypothetical protein
MELRQYTWTDQDAEMERASHYSGISCLLICFVCAFEIDENTIELGYNVIKGTEYFVSL